MAATPKNKNASPRVVEVPVILTAQTSSIALTTAFTPLYSGLYRVTVYMNISTVGSGGNVDHTIGWTDSLGAKTLAYAAINANAANFSQDKTVFWCTAGSAITYVTKVTGFTGGAAYDFYLTVERLTEVSS